MAKQDAKLDRIISMLEELLKRVPESGSFGGTHGTPGFQAKPESKPEPEPEVQPGITGPPEPPKEEPPKKDPWSV